MASDPASGTAACGEFGGQPPSGRGGEGHYCKCVLKPGHMESIPWAGHGCICGHVWGRTEKEPADDNT